ncbi:MAG: ATP-binding protein [Bacillota bacterium]
MSNPYPRRSLKRELAISLTVGTVGVALLVVLICTWLSFSALISQKEELLLAVASEAARLMVTHHGEALTQAGVGPADRETALLQLHDILLPLSRAVVGDHPQVVVGFYSRDLDGVVCAYSSDEGDLSHMVGASLKPDDGGRLTWTTGESSIGKGSFRSIWDNYVLTCDYPVAIDDRVIGHAFANVTLGQVWMIYLHLIGPFIPVIAAAVATAAWLLGRYFRRLTSDLDGLLISVEDKRGGPGRLHYREFDRIACTNQLRVRDLKHSKELFRAMLRSVPVALIVVDSAGCIIELGERAETLYRLDRTSWLGRPLADLFPGDTEFERITWSLAHGEAVSGECLSHAATLRGNNRIVRYQAFPMQLPNGELGAAFIIHDVTREKELERQLRWADRLRTVGEMAAMAAHEIRNPLTAVRGTAQLGGRITREPRTRELFGRIVEQVDYLKEFTGLLLDLTKPIEGTPARGRICRLLHECLELVALEADQAGVMVKESYRSDPLVMVDERLMRQAFLNVIRNGIQAMPRGGTLGITTESEEGELRIHITDNGTGMSQETQNCIFSSFYTTKGRQGTGLGLPATYQIVTSVHHGRIWFTSQEGVGTTFSIALPLVRRVTRPSRRPIAREMAAGQE